jgi:hypothetical protein
MRVRRINTYRDSQRASLSQNRGFQHGVKSTFLDDVHVQSKRVTDLLFEANEVYQTPSCVHSHE